MNLPAHGTSLDPSLALLRTNNTRNHDLQRYRLAQLKRR